MGSYPSAIMPAAAAIDVNIRIYQLYQAGKKDETKTLFYRLILYVTLALQHLELVIEIEKRLLLQRGAAQPFSTTRNTKNKST